MEQPFTVAAYLARMAAVRGVPEAACKPWAERLGMVAFLDVPLGDLSKGSAHKVGLAQALLAPPGLLILDEPFSGLDAQTRAELPTIIDEITTGGGIVVLSDHQSGLAGQPGVTHLSMDNGAVHSTAAPLTLAGSGSISGDSAAISEVDSGSGFGAGPRSGSASREELGYAARTSTKSIIEIVVDTTDAEAVTQKLLAEGYNVVVRTEAP